MSISFAKAVRALLMGDPAVAASLPGGIHPARIPQEAALPAAAYESSSDPLTSITGVIAIRSASLSLHGIAATVAQCEAMDTAVRALIEANSGQVTRQGTTIMGLRYSGNSIDAEDLSDGDDEPLRRLDMTITGLERAAT